MKLLRVKNPSSQLKSENQFLGKKFWSSELPKTCGEGFRDAVCMGCHPL